MQNQNIKEFKRVLVANRGEIAIRVSRALNDLGLQSIGVFSKEDKYAAFRTKADESYILNPNKGPIDAYLDIDEIIKIAKERKVEEKKKCVEGQYIDRRTKGCQIIRAVLAEVVDYRNELEKWDAESQKVVDYLERLTPSEYVCKTKDSGRRINL